VNGQWKICNAMEKSKKLPRLALILKEKIEIENRNKKQKRK
jgi:hypothetical protein